MKVHNFHPKKTPENKKSALVATSPTAGNKMVTPQTVRLTNLEQRLKDRHNRTNSVKYGGYQVQQPQNHQAAAALPKIQKCTVPNTMAKATSTSKQS